VGTKKKKIHESKQSVGRPSKYEPRFAEMLIKFFDKPVTKTVKKTIVHYGQQIEIPVEVPETFPSLAAFAISIGVNKDTVLEWATASNDDGSLKHPEFSGAYKRAKDFQERYLVENGLKGIIQPLFTKFVCINVLNWKEKTEVTNPDGSLAPQVHIILPDNGRDKK
jgi:hypothetical protein